ncbi:MAG: alanine-tRNA synthetase second additional domain-containing protein [Clostridia bacterium]|nr:alanine-tRNA synthetase second additional domain-containing protein [Clostridia bacterium]
MYAAYFAPRGVVRMADLGSQIAQRHLNPFDKLIGVVGEAGSGKSMIVKGMFPGLEMTNDDNGVNVRPLPLLDIEEESIFYSPHTYHVDIRFEMAFTQIFALAQAIMAAVNKGKRVVVEHFELVRPYLSRNADLLIGVGEEIIVTRPNIFGPEPQELADTVFKSIKYRKMAHTAEDLTERQLFEKYRDKYVHGDVHRGFILHFPEKPDLDIQKIEQYVKTRIADNIPVSFKDETHIMFGEKVHFCTGPRTHVKNTGEIEGFRLLPDYFYDPITQSYMLVGRVGVENDKPLDYSRLNTFEL